MTENAAETGTWYTNHAEGDANVGAMFGVVNGNVHIYDVRGEDTPRRRYEVALNCLRGNMARRAEELIRQVVAEGMESAEIAYHWALAILSGRSFDHLGDQELKALEKAGELAARHHADEWSRASSVVSALISCLLEQERAEVVDHDGFAEVLLLFEGLPDARQEEIRRHLDMILTGGVQDQIDAVYAEQAAEQRMSGNRTERVWKFFEPEPEPPRAPRREAPKLTMGGKAQAVIAGLFLLPGLFVVLTAAPGWLPVHLLLLVSGGFLVVRYGIEQHARTRLTATYEKHYFGRRPASPPPEDRTEPEDPGNLDDEFYDEHADQARDAERHLHRAAFEQEVGGYVDYRLSRHRPKRGSGDKLRQRRNQWDDEMRPIRDDLVADLLARYRHPLPAQGAIRWLIRWRIRKLAEAWRQERLHDSADRLAAPTSVFLGGAAGILLTAAGILSAGWHAVTSLPAPGVIGLLLVVAGAWIASGDDLFLYPVKVRAHELQTEEDAARLAEETAAHQEWLAELADRPGDAEMARWLDYDLIHIKTQALRYYTMTNRDIMAHAVLTEAAPGCLRARVLHGPPRYDAYLVTLFLLNETGVRQVTVRLDFRTGITGNEERMNFQYNSIAAVQVVEVGVRLSDRKRLIVLLDGHDRNSELDGRSLVMAQALHLSLTSGQMIDVVAENFDQGLIDRLRENPERLLELALDTSGIRGAARILEAVAAEGHRWIAQEKARRQRRLIDFARRSGERRALRGRPETPALTSSSPAEAMLISLAGESGFARSYRTGSVIEMVHAGRSSVVYVDRGELEQDTVAVIVAPTIELDRLRSVEGLAVPSVTGLVSGPDLRMFPRSGDGHVGYRIGCRDLAGYRRLLEHV
ncbi:hypothetical protein [Herbidospora sp. RD11066]